jgi:replicative DNA helicase
MGAWGMGHIMEKEYLGCLLQDNTLLQDYPINSKWLAEYNKTLYEIIKKQSGEGLCNILTLSKAQPSKASYIASLTDNAFKAKIEYYIRKIKENYNTKELKKISEAIKVKLNSRETIEEVINYVATQINNIESGGADYKKISEYLYDYIDNKEKIYKQEITTKDIETGISALDNRMYGLRESNLIVIASRPNVGKSALIKTIAINMLKNNRRIGLFTFEMTANEYIDRIYSDIASINGNALRTMYIGKDQFEKMLKKSEEIYGYNLYINDSSRMNIINLRSVIREMVRKNNTEIIFIDYIGLIEMIDKRKSRYEHISEVSRELKKIAGEYKVPVVVACQINRAGEKEPTLANLRDSGSIEQDADVVIILNKKDDNEKEREIIIAKNRNGSIGRDTILFEPTLTRFYENS